MLALRELFLFYFFFFYTYFYFTVDEEYMVFIVIFIWLLFFLAFYSKKLYYFFQDNSKLIVKEYFVFHDKRNLFLAVIKNQYSNFININKSINLLLTVILKDVNKCINNRIISLHKKDFLSIMERLNFFKTNIKAILVLYRLHFFNIFYKFIYNLVIIYQKFFNFFYKQLCSIKLELEVSKDNNLEKFNNDLIFYCKNICNSKFKIFFDRDFLINQLIFFKLSKLKNKKSNKKLLKIFKIIKLISSMKRTVFSQDLEISKDVLKK
jgi:hypothetical protein